MHGNQNNLHIVNPNHIVLKSIQIIDVLGRVVYAGNAAGSAIIPVNGVSGIYIIRLVSDDGKISSTKVQLGNYQLLSRATILAGFTG